MPDLIALLSNSSQSLAAARGAVATAAHNLQNVNTPGFSRQRAVIESSVPEEVAGGMYVGRGSRMTGVTQARDRFLESQVHYTYGNEARSRTAASMLGGVHIFDAAQPGGVGDSLSGLFDSIRLLSQDPTNSALRDGTINSAKALQTAFQREAQNISVARQSLDREVEAKIVEVNNLSKKVATMNHQIMMAKLNGGSQPNDLMDARRNAQDRLSELLGAYPVTDSQGKLNLSLPHGGSVVVGDRASTLKAVPDPDNGGHVRLVLVDADGGKVDLPNSSFSGELGGVLSARDDTLHKSAKKLDRLAFSIAKAFNQAHEESVDLNNDKGAVLFDAGATPDGAAAKIKVNPLIAADASRLATRGAATGRGDNAGALALLKLERTAVEGSDSPVNAYARLTADFGTDTAAARASAEHDAALKDHLSQMRDSVSGVSVDEELVEMTKAQRAYEAIGKVIATGDQMLKTLLDLK